jgi:hypothetical protein
MLEVLDHVHMKLATDKAGFPPQYIQRTSLTWVTEVCCYLSRSWPI